MSDSEVDKHIEAVRHEVREHEWGPERVETGFRELLVRRQKDHHDDAWGPARVEAAFRELLVRHQKDATRYRKAASIGGAVIALAAVLALGFFGWRSLAPGEAPSVKGAETAAHTERLALGEGTEVHFDQGTRLDVRERTDARVVVAVQAGIARFRVQHDPRRLFRVEAGEVLVEDIGTTFAVENAGNTVKVSVSEGSVAVSFPESGGAARGKATLRAGESGTYPLRAARTSSTDGTSALLDEPVAPEPSGQAPTTAPETETNWRELARAGQHRRAYDLLSPGGFRDVRDEPGDLLLASDVARLSRHPAESVTQLKKLLARHPRDPRAPSAAFTLGWLLMNELGRPREAAAAFAKAESLAPRGNLAEDAVARSVEAWYRAGELVRARAEVERYRKTYPQGRHLGMLQRLVGTP